MINEIWNLEHRARRPCVEAASSRPQPHRRYESPVLTAIAHFDDVSHRSIQPYSPKETFPPNLVNWTFRCAFLLDIAGQEETNSSFDSKSLGLPSPFGEGPGVRSSKGGFEFDSFRSRAAVTLRIKPSDQTSERQASIVDFDDSRHRSQASLGNIDDTTEGAGVLPARRCKSAETPASSRSRDSVTLRIVEIDLSNLETLQAPTFRAVYLQQSTGQNNIAVLGKIKTLADLWVTRHAVIDATGVGES
jgi:hypothetical protein